MVHTTRKKLSQLTNLNDESSRVTERIFFALFEIKDVDFYIVGLVYYVLGVLTEKNTGKVR